MAFSDAFVAVSQTGIPESLDSFQDKIPFEWIESAIKLTDGFATLRRRRLPAEQVVWLVIAMGLFRDRPISEVVDKLDLALPHPKHITIAPSAISQARSRIGEAPLKALFEICAREWAHRSAAEHQWRGLSLYGIDGSIVRVPDSEENRAHFGGHTTNYGESGYPLLRMVVLMALRSHLLAAVEFGPNLVSEQAYAKELREQIPDNSLTIVDRNFSNGPSLIQLGNEALNRHWLTRAKDATNRVVLKQLSPRDQLVEMTISPKARAKEPSLPEKWTARAIHYQYKGFEPKVLLTSLLDIEKYPAEELIALYHERWELELGFDEIKTEMLDREETIRSRTVEGVNQELWGIFIAYNLVRLEMVQIAKQEKVEPVRISFVMSLRMIQDEMLWLAVTSPGAIPKRLKELRRKLSRFVLPPRRSERSYPRVVKVTNSSYRSKPPKKLLN